MYKKSNNKKLLFGLSLSVIFTSLVLGFIGGFIPQVSADHLSSSSSSSSSSLSSPSSFTANSSYYNSNSSKSSYQQDCKWAITIFGYTYYVVVPCGTPLSIETDGPVPISSSSYSSSSYNNSSSLYSSSSSYPYSSYSSTTYNPSSSSSTSYSSQPLSSSSSYSSPSSSSSQKSSSSNLPSSSTSSSMPSSSYSSLSSLFSSSSSALSSVMSSASSSSSKATSCPVVINNSDFYYKGGNVSISNYSPMSLNNIAIKIILPSGVNVSSSSGASYQQIGNVLTFYIPSIGSYTNIDTSYVHNYLGYYPVVTTIECNQSQPVGSDQFFK